MIAKCSEPGCRETVEVYCQCVQPRLFLCADHGYRHYKDTSHDLEDVTLAKFSMNIRESDIAIMLGKTKTSSDVVEGPSVFQKTFRKYLKHKSEEELSNFNISSGLKQYLFEVKYKVPCFICKKAVSYIKLHLFELHSLDENDRTNYWELYRECYTGLGLVIDDIV